MVPTLTCGFERVNFSLPMALSDASWRDILFIESVTAETMEPTTGFEPVTPSLPRKCSTPEPRGLLRHPWNRPRPKPGPSPTVKPCDPTSSPYLCKAPSFEGDGLRGKPDVDVPGRRRPRERTN